MNREEIITVLSELHKITGFRISLHGTDFEEIAAYPDSPLPFCAAVNSIKSEHERCLECDRIACRRAVETKKTHVYRCRYGLTEAVSPLYNFGILTGFLMMGQVAECDEDRARADKMLHRLTDSYTEENFSEKIPLVGGEIVSSYFRIMTICAQYLTLSNAMHGRRASFAEDAMKYIRDNLTKKITVADICHAVGCSKSTLLVGFKKSFGITVGDYITEQRLKAAEELLCGSERSINEIALDTGFSDQSYFSKVFSQSRGVSPKEFRIKNTEEKISKL